MQFNLVSFSDLYLPFGFHEIQIQASHSKWKSQPMHIYKKYNFCLIFSPFWNLKFSHAPIIYTSGFQFPAISIRGAKKKIPQKRIRYWKFLIYFPSIHTNREPSSHIYIYAMYTFFQRSYYLLSHHVFPKDINRWILSHSPNATTSFSLTRSSPSYSLL